MTTPKEAEASSYVVELLPALGALRDPRFGPGVLDLIVAAGASALGLDPEPRECFTCRRPWSPARHLVTVLTVEFPGEEAGLVAGVCGGCAGSGRTLELVLAGLERDLGPAAEVRAVHPEARA
jgi:hypothetical protein